MNIALNFKNVAWVFVAGSLFLVGCTTKQVVTNSAEYTNTGDLKNFRVESEAQVAAPPQPQELEVIPIEINEKVEMWINYFQGRGRGHIERYLARSTRYEAIMKKVLRDNKLPEDLFYIALIESGFSPSALSRASAVGYWQFIRGTGKRYKLQINQLVDDRRDPVLATQAAADYFKDLYGLFDSWYLSMAAYNVGEGRVQRAIRKYKTRDFWELVRNKKALPKETDNYVPKYIAAKLIAKNPDKYGFDGIDYMPPIEFDYLTFEQPVNMRLMAERMNVNYEDFKDLNPKYKGEIAPLDNGSLSLRIPPGSREAAIIAAKESMVASVEFIPDQNELQVYKVKHGDTFSTLARRFRTSSAYIREINDFPRKRKLRAGQRIFVPDRTPLQEKRPVVMAKDGTRFHIVQPGDSFSSIAEKYKITVADLKKINKFNRKSILKSGTRIMLPENAVVEPEKKNSQSSTLRGRLPKRRVARSN